MPAGSNGGTMPAKAGWLLLSPLHKDSGYYICTVVETESWAWGELGEQLSPQASGGHALQHSTEGSSDLSQREDQAPELIGGQQRPALLQGQVLGCQE